jgi:hypothetical protein
MLDNGSMSTKLEKQKTGRPSIITETTVRNLELALRNGFSITTACKLSGVSRATYYEHINSSAEFSDRMELAEQWVTYRAKHVIALAIHKGDIKVCQWWLERKARVEFAPPKGM